MGKVEFPLTTFQGWSATVTLHPDRALYGPVGFSVAVVLYSQGIT